MILKGKEIHASSNGAKSGEKEKEKEIERQEIETEEETEIVVAKILQPCMIPRISNRELYVYGVSAYACMENELRITEKVQGHPNIIHLLGIDVFSFHRSFYPKYLKRAVPLLS